MQSKTNRTVLRKILNAKEVEHLQLQLVELGTANNQTVERSTKIHVAQFLQGSETNKLVIATHTRQAHSERLRRAHYFTQPLTRLPPFPFFSSTSRSSSIAWLHVMKRGGRYTVRPFTSSLKSGSFTLMSTR